MATNYRRRFPVRREPVSVTMRRNQAYLSAMVLPEQRARFEADFPESRLPALPKKREPRVSHGSTEAPVLAAVGELLAVHPAVLFAVRQNSGAAMTERDGRMVPLHFYRMLRKPEEMTISDFWGVLKGGRPFAFEAKRPSWDKPRTDHEYRQQAFLAMIQSIGGLAAFVRSADEVGALLA